MTIGSPNAAQFEFEDGLLRSIEIERRRKTVLSAKESFLNAFPLNFAPVTRPYMPRAHGEPGAEYPTLHSNQKLGSGIRDIEVKQSREQTSKREAGIRVASLENRFQMSSAATWVLLLEDVVNLTEEESTKLLFQMPDKVRLTVESTEPIQSQLEVIDGRLRASIQVTLPVGHSSLRLEVRSFPAFDFSKTVVFCRSDQLREAAIVVSCVPEHGFTPVVTLEPPPVSAEEYKKLSRIAEASRNAYVAAAGAKLGGSGDPAEYQKVRFKWEHDQQSLTPYRSWQKRNARVSEILNGAGIEVALILFEPEDEDLRIDDPLYLEEFHRFASLMAGDKSAPEATEGILANFRRRIFFLHKSETISDSESDEDCRYHYRDLRELSQKAWSKLTSNRQPASDAIEVPAEGSNTYLMGLFCALRHGLPLRPGNPSTSGLQETFDATNEAIDTDEAVLVEDYGDSTTALGVLYANYRAARLIIVPSPDLSEVERAIASFQNRIDAASKSVSSAAEPSSRAQEICPVLPLENKAPDDKGSRSPPHADEKSGHMADLLWTFLSNSGRTEPYAEIEAAVSVQVPSSLPESVGGRRLTVFTKGLPYSFFNPPGTEWSRKPIGHVVGDPALIVLSEIYANGLDRPEAAFSAVFDPGFFRTSETKDVLASIRLHFTHPMVFSNQNANFDALTRLAGMPLELIFFNTHGSDDAIVLADGPLENYQLLQWLKLKSFPVVFNNSCKSWIGTGKEFISVGARGYVGTLWSVPSDSAAIFARTVVKRLITEGAAPAEAIRQVDAAAKIERAYIYVGTANGRLDQRPDFTVKSNTESCLSAARTLFEAASNSQGDLAVRFYEEAQGFKQLLREYGWLNSIEGADLLLNELGLVARKPALLRHNPTREEKLVSECSEMLEGLEISDSEKNQRRAVLYEALGQIRERDHQPAEALVWYERSIEHDNNSRADTYLHMAQIFYEQGRLDEAMQLGLRVKVESESGGSKFTLMHGLGLLAQISRVVRQYDEALRYINEGFELAGQIPLPSEQGIFKQDEANVYLAKGDLDRALVAAFESLRLYRVGHAPESESHAYEQLTRIFDQKGDREKAASYAAAGLEHSRRIGDKPLQAAFLRAFGDIRRKQRLLKEAVGYYESAALIYRDIGRIGFLSGIWGNVAAAAIELADVPLLWKAIAQEVSAGTQLSTEMQRSLIPSVVNHFKHAAESGNVENTTEGLNSVWNVEGISSARDTAIVENPSDFQLLISDLIVAVGQWLLGKPEAAVIIGRALDLRTEPPLELEAYFQRLSQKSVRKPKPVPFWKRLFG